jgi:hypothetical protein
MNDRDSKKMENREKERTKEPNTKIKAIQINYVKSWKANNLIIVYKCNAFWKVFFGAGFNISINNLK